MLNPTAVSPVVGTMDFLFVSMTYTGWLYILEAGLMVGQLHRNNASQCDTKL